MIWPGEVFRAYAAILAGILVVAGTLLALLTWVLHKDTRSIWATYRSWLVMIPLAAAAIWLGRVPTIALFVLLSVFGFKEFSRATGLYRDWWMTGAVYLSLAAIGVTAVMAN
ncbi:MAG: hypothetical protein ABSH20_08980, partial [Tepidisphaeraceae bacterium]